MKKKIFALFFAVFLFQAGFGLYYAISEHKRGQYFDPLAPSSEYFQHQILDAWNAPRAWGDLEAYNRAAYSLITRHGFETLDGQPSAWVTPGFPAFLALLYSAFGYHFFAVLFFNALCVTLAYAALSQLGARVFSSATGITTFILLCLNLRMSMFVGYIYTESLFVSILALTLYGAVEIYRNPAKRWPAFLALGLLSGFGVLVRPAFLGVVPVVALFLFFRSRGGLRKNFLSTLLYGLTSLSLLTAWVVRNQTLLGEPLVTTNSVYALSEGNQDFYKAFTFGDVYKNAPSQTPYGPLPPVLASENRELKDALFLRDQFREWKSKNSRFYLWLTTWRFKSFWMPYTADMSPRNQAISLFLWLIIFPAGLLGWYRNRKDPVAWLFGLSTVGLIALPSLVVVGPSLRYQLPAQILLSLLAATEYARIAARARVQ